MTVIKKTVSADGFQAKGDDVFTFRLEKQDETGWSPVAETVYSVSDMGTYSYKTDGDGLFTLKAGQAGVFKNLPFNETYRVTEVMSSLSRSYTCNASEQEVTLTENGETIVFTNVYNPQIQLEVIKVDGMDQSIYLQGVTFELYADKGLTNLIDTQTTDELGSISFDNLSDGTYYLSEVNAPDGYRQPRKPYAVTLSWTYNDEDVTATGSGIELVRTDGNAVTMKSTCCLLMGSNLLWRC